MAVRTGVVRDVRVTYHFRQARRRRDGRPRLRVRMMRMERVVGGCCRGASFERDSNDSPTPRLK